LENNNTIFEEPEGKMEILSEEEVISKSLEATYFDFDQDSM